MGFLDKEIGRRRFLARGAAGAIVVLAGGATIGTIIARQLEKSGTVTIDPNFITEKNLKEKLQKYLPEPFGFPVTNVPHLPEVTKDSDVDNLPKLGSENSQFLSDHGIQSFSVAQDERTNRFLVSISFLPDTKPGKLLNGSDPNPQWPAFILYGNGEVFKVEPVRDYELYKLTKNSPNLIGNFYFPVKRNQIIGEKVIILLNNQLINVAGQDLPPFALPFLVQIESPGPFV